MILINLNFNNNKSIKAINPPMLISINKMNFIKLISRIKIQLFNKFQNKNNLPL